ncbi:hypothetical protein BBJ28_00009463 [Nothophytophthora sp. Chile5]|nr:hypothetical protein BBJ28_00009463 [Nothophytophthora sp. Chile5]
MGMKLLSSQLDELRADLETASRARESSGRMASRPESSGLWCPKPPGTAGTTSFRATRLSNDHRHSLKQAEDTDSSSSSLETLVLRVLERPAAVVDGYLADQEEGTAESEETKLKSLESEGSADCEDDLLQLLSALESQEAPSNPPTGSDLQPSDFGNWMATEERDESRPAAWRPIATATAVHRSKKPPSAYDYYQKLVRDFASLEHELQSHEVAQGELQARLDRARATTRASETQQLEAQRVQWERDRDCQLDAVVQQSTTLDALQAETEALGAQELRLLAEMEVLRERQQEASETDARRLRRLVHEHTNLLEDELAKGKLDLDYIAQVVSTTRRQELNYKAQRPTDKTSSISTMQTLVDGVQQRRRQEFDAAEANFQERMRSFQREQDALATKAKALCVTKQRALKILSQNQQEAIKGFFDAAPAADKREEATVLAPSLDFGEILQSLNQSGAQVEHIQSLDSSRDSGRRDLTNGLQAARATLDQGPRRVESIEKRLLDRKKEALKLGIVVEQLDSRTTGCGGGFRIESYSPRQVEVVYFLRGLIFGWMDAAVIEASAQPNRELLEMEVLHWQTTHSNIEQERQRERTQQYAQKLLGNLVSEVMVEIAEDIRLEFQASAHRVRGVFANVFDRVFFVPSSEKPAVAGAKKTPVKPPALQVSGQPTLRSTLFATSFEHMKTLRSQRNDPKATVRLHQRSQSVLRQPMEAATSPPSAIESPGKKLFGLFNSSQNSKPTSASAAQPLRSQPTVPNTHEGDFIPLLTSDATCSPSSAARRALTFWENEPTLRLRTITAPSSVGFCSCMQLSSNGDLLVCGTMEGALVLWDLLQDPPAILRLWTPPKTSPSRFTHVALSVDAQLVVVFNKRKTVSVFAVNPTSGQPKGNAKVKPKPVAHSDDCFPAASAKHKPRSLEILMELSAPEVLAQPSFTLELQERAPAVVAKALSIDWTPPELSCASFFVSFSLLGLTTRDVSVLCGTSTGDLLKFNLQPQRNSGAVALPHGTQATFDAPGPEDVEPLNTTSIRREFFRGHRQSVLFASCIQRKSDESGNFRPTEILSVDQEANVCLWEYNAARFVGFGWFEPTQKLRLDLQRVSSDLLSSTTAPTKPRGLSAPPEPPVPTTVKGEMLQIALTPDDTSLVCMVYYADPAKKTTAGTLRFLQLITASMRLSPVRLDVDIPKGSTTPRFALTSSFLLLLLNNRVHVYALHSGKEVREPVGLPPQGQQQATFNSITSATNSSSRVDVEATSRRGRRQRDDITALHFVVGSSQHARLLVHSFTASSPRSSRGPEKEARIDRKR